MRGLRQRYKFAPSIPPPPFAFRQAQEAQDEGCGCAGQQQTMPRMSGLSH